MTEFVLYCIDENKCRQMVDELLRAIRDDKDIADDTAFYIFGNGKSATKSEMVDKQFNFTADCFLLGVWHFLIRERSESNRIGRDTLVDWYGTSTETYGKSQIGTELRRNVWEPLGREIRVIPSERKVLKKKKPFRRTMRSKSISCSFMIWTVFRKKKREFGAFEEEPHTS